MTLKIEFYIPEEQVTNDRARQYLARAMSAIGFAPDDMPAPVQNPNPGPRVNDAEAKEIADRAADAQRAEQVAAQLADEPARERGKPAPGKARRTKAEIEEDEAADRADEGMEDIDPANISTGEERVDPNADQDADDEAADPANAPASEATRDDVRAAMMAYSKDKGMPALTADMSAILAEQFPDGKVTKLSEIPEDAAAFQRVIDALAAKLEG